MSKFVLVFRPVLQVDDKEEFCASRANNSLYLWPPELKIFWVNFETSLETTDLKLFINGSRTVRYNYAMLLPN